MSQSVRSKSNPSIQIPVRVHETNAPTLRWNTECDVAIIIRSNHHFTEMLMMNDLQCLFYPTIQFNSIQSTRLVKSRLGTFSTQLHHTPSARHHPRWIRTLRLLHLALRDTASDLRFERSQGAHRHRPVGEYVGSCCL